MGSEQFKRSEKDGEIIIMIVIIVVMSKIKEF